MSEEQQPRAQTARRSASLASRLASFGVFGSAALGVVQFYQPPRQFIESRGEVAILEDSTGPLALPSRDAFGRSGEVRVLFVLPGDTVTYPMELRGDPAELTYAWIPFSDTGSVQALPADSTRPLVPRFEAPSKPGF